VARPPARRADREQGVRRFGWARRREAARARARVHRRLRGVRGGAAMKAILFDRPGDESVLYLGEAPEPALGVGEVRLAVRACAVNRADLLQRQGMYPPPPGASPILGLECAGEIAEI